MTSRSNQKNSSVNMKHYTIGAFFNSPFYQEVLLIEKNSHGQKGKRNLPGGKVNFEENPLNAIVREFIEETGFVVPQNEWTYAGSILCQSEYKVSVYVAVNNHNIWWQPDYKEGYPAFVNVNRLPDNIVPNLRWLIPFCADLHKRRKDKGEQLFEGVFNYKIL